MNSELAEIVKQNYIADVFFQREGGRKDYWKDP